MSRADGSKASRRDACNPLKVNAVTEAEPPAFRAQGHGGNQDGKLRLGVERTTHSGKLRKTHNHKLWQFRGGSACSRHETSHKLYAPRRAKYRNRDACQTLHLHQKPRLAALSESNLREGLWLGEPKGVGKRDGHPEVSVGLMESGYLLGNGISPVLWF